MLEKPKHNLPYDIIEIKGNDRITFLQGLLTQDVEQLGTRAKYAGFCNHKGRLLATMLLYQTDKAIYLRVHIDTVEFFLAQLKRFVFRSKDEFRVIKNAVHVLDEAACKAFFNNAPAISALDDHQCTFLENATLIKSIVPLHYLVITEKALSSDVDTAWFLSESLKQGDFNTYPETAELFLAQNTPLPNLQAISYTKGCYIGQEIIARTKYLGKTKRFPAWVELNLESSNLPDVCLNQPIKNKAGVEVGHVIDAIIATSKTTLLVLLQDNELTNLDASSPVFIHNNACFYHPFNVVE